MKFFVSFLLILLLSFAACLYFPWWSIAVVAFIISALIPQGPVKSFLAAFLALFVFWAGLSSWISYKNEHLFAHKISLLIFKMDNVILLILATGLIGAIVAGFAALSGSYFRRMLK